jgi:hypothetical protein
MAELQDSLGADRLARCPVPQVEAAKEGFVRGVAI